MGCGGSKVDNEPDYTPPPTGSTENGPKLCLVRKGSSDALVFEHAHRLSGPGGAQLTLRSHPGWAVVPRYDYPRSAKEWRYIELGLGPAEMAAHMQLQGGFLVRLHDERVMDINHWNYEEGNALNVLRSAHNHPGNTRYTNGGRSFVVNVDGTISPMKAQHLVLGASMPRFSFVQSSSPNKCVFEHTQSLINGGRVPLTLASHPGLAVVQGFDEPREAFHEWHYKALHIGPSERAIVVSRKGTCLVDGQDWYVTPSMLNVHDGNHTDLVRNRFDHPSRLLEEHSKHGSKRPLDLSFNQDGTISPISQPHLCLGCEFAPMLMAGKQSAAASSTASSLADEAPHMGEVPMGSVQMGKPVQMSSAVPVANVVEAVPVHVPVYSTSKPGAGSSSSSQDPPPLKEIADIFKAQLGIERSTNIADTVDQACRELGVPVQGTLIERATQGWHALGAPSVGQSA